MSIYHTIRSSFFSPFSVFLASSIYSDVSKCECFIASNAKRKKKKDRPIPFGVKCFPLKRQDRYWLGTWKNVYICHLIEVMLRLKTVMARNREARKRFILRFWTLTEKHFLVTGHPREWSATLCEQENRIGWHDNSTNVCKYLYRFCVNRLKRLFNMHNIMDIQIILLNIIPIVMYHIIISI